VEGFEQVWQAYFGDVYRYALALCRDKVLAEDIASDTFMKAMAAIDRFRGECELRVWLCRIAKNLYLDHLRRQGRQVSLETLPEPEDPADLEATFHRGEEAMRAHRALHLLPEPYREVFSLRVLGGLSFQQIGELFHKTANWACVTYHRARQQLRDSMEEET
jgi:RNA polymerase sigma-70 factor (ECF subfamily)